MNDTLYLKIEGAEKWMTKFLFITDTHIGTETMEFFQQPAYPGKIETLLELLLEPIKEQNIDFIIHGGDMIHSYDQNLIKKAIRIFNLPIPTYLCLGNHDLDDLHALNGWLEHAPSFFINHSPNYQIVTKTCIIHVVPNQWEVKREYYWGNVQEPSFTKEQLRQLERDLQDNLDKVHILVTHSPVFGMSIEQSGLSQVIHEPPAMFQQTILQLTEKYPHLQLVLSGHNHLNTIHKLEKTAFVTASSFVESPFEYKLVEINSQQINLSTHIIPHSQLDFYFRYNPERSYVQGREKDRTLTLLRNQNVEL